MSWVTSSFHPAIGRRRYRYQSERVLYRAHWQHMCVWIEHLGELEGLEGLFTSNNFRMDILCANDNRLTGRYGSATDGPLTQILQ